MDEAGNSATIAHPTPGPRRREPRRLPPEPRIGTVEFANGVLGGAPSAGLAVGMSMCTDIETPVSRRTIVGMSCLSRVVKVAVVSVAATFAGWRLFEALYVWADHVGDAEVVSGQSEWFAGTTQYLIANAAGWTFVPVSVWGLLRLMRVRANYLAVAVCAVVWIVFTAPRLVGSHSAPGAIAVWVGVQAAATVAGSVLSPRLSPSRAR